MRQSWRRITMYPAVRLLLLLVVGILLQWHAPQRGLSITIVSIVAMLCGLLFHGMARRYRALLPLRDLSISLLLILIGMLRTAAMLENRPRDLIPFADQKEKVFLVGVVTQQPRIYPDKRRFHVDCRWIVAGDSIPVSGSVLATYRRSAYERDDTLTTIRVGDLLRLRCRLRLPQTIRNPGGFDTRTWLLEEGSVLLCSVSKGSDLQVLGHEDPGMWASLTQAIRSAMRTGIAQLFPERHASIMVGLLLGDRGMIDADTVSDFRTTGIMHILAVSGLHAGIILLIVFMPLQRLPFPLRAFIALMTLWLFAGITGFAPPVTRAATMATLLLGGILLQRSGDSVNALAAAGVLILLVDPISLLGLSFQLSFSAVLGILLFQDKLQHALLLRIPRRLRSSLLKSLIGLFSLSLSAQALSLPLMVNAFGQLSPSGLIANLVAVPMVFLVVTCGVLSLLLLPIAPFLSQPFAAVAEASLDLIMASSGFLATLPGAVITLPELPTLVLFAYLAAILYLTATQGRMRQKLLLIGIGVIAAVIATAAMDPAGEPDLRVTFLDVGQGDAAVIELPDGSAILIDTGPSGGNMDAGSAVILPFLRARGISMLHGMIITHPDDDHAGGAHSVLEALPVEHIFIGGRWPEGSRTSSLMTYMIETADSVRDVRAGDRIALPGNATLYVLSPPAEIDCEASNEHSVVVLLLYGSTRFLFTGDTDAQAEHRMIARYDNFLRADVLKVAHHGSTTSTSPGFAVKVRPKHAVISAGRNNHFNHPRQEILDRLRLVGATISRTDIEGAIMFTSDGKSVRKVSPR